VGCGGIPLGKTPLDSTTISAPTSAQGMLLGSRSEKVFISLSPMRRTLPSSETSSSQMPWVESCLNRLAKDSKGIRSFAATTSMSSSPPPRLRAALVNSIPIRPKPLTPTLTATSLSYLSLSLATNTIIVPENPGDGSARTLEANEGSLAHVLRRPLGTVPDSDFDLLSGCTWQAEIDPSEAGSR
jgi:hypothetical protein